MSGLSLLDLQASVKDRTAFSTLDDYFLLGQTYLEVMQQQQPTRIISPSRPHYIFYQYPSEFSHNITRPLNTNLFFENPEDFTQALICFGHFFADLKKYQGNIIDQPTIQSYLETREISKVIYTIQQAIGCVGDSFTIANQARKRIGQLFEQLIRLIIAELGLACEPRTITLPIPDYPDYTMTYELDLVFSRQKVILTAETPYIYPGEVIGSVKTTSKDRIDKVFLDKYLLSKLLGRDIPVIAIFLHDVQRARRGNSIFGINSTFKSNHFLGYTVALNRLDGVYYVDVAPDMLENERLMREIKDFQQFLIVDLWTLAK